MVSEQVYISGVFVAGLLSFFAPCILPLLPVYVAFLGGNSQPRSYESPEHAAPASTIKRRVVIHPLTIVRTLLFVLGISTVFVLLGFGAGTFGRFINHPNFIIICGAVVIGFGIYQTGWIRIPWLERDKKLKWTPSPRKNMFQAYLLGFTFSFGWTPCIGPVLAAILGISAGEGSIWYGGLLMLIYAMGLAIPFLIVAIFSDIVLQQFKKLYPYMGILKVFSGGLLIVMGILLMSNNLHSIIRWFE